MDTKLFGRNQPGGLFSIVDREDFPTGTIWWVGSTVATCSDAAGFGQNPDAPFATLAYAVGTACAAGDTIFLLPGHAEALIAATTLDMDLAGVTVIGLGRRHPAAAVFDRHRNDCDVQYHGRELPAEKPWLRFNPGKRGGRHHAFRNSRRGHD